MIVSPSSLRSFETIFFFGPQIFADKVRWVGVGLRLLYNAALGVVRKIGVTAAVGPMRSNEVGEWVSMRE